MCGRHAATYQLQLATSGAIVLTLAALTSVGPSHSVSRESGYQEIE
jgi:hypothetical protein